MSFVYRRTYKGTVKLVIFDWAGTTMDYGCHAPAVVFVEVFKRRGVEITMEQARVFPPEAVVKIDDTKPGITEGLNAGVRTIGLSKTGNEVGLNEQELAALSAEEVKRKVDRAADGLAKSGAHYVVESIADVPAVIAEIEQRLKMGERP